MPGSEDEFGISTTIVDNTDDSDDDIIDFEDISPGMDDRLEEEELNKQQQMPTATLPFGNPTTPSTSSGSTTGSIFGPPSAQQQQTNNWNPGNFGFTSNQNNSYIPPSSSIWNSNNNNNYSGWSNNNNNNSAGWSWGGSGNNNSFNAFNNSPGTGSGWGSWGVNNSKPNNNIQTIPKKIVFCSLIDTIICSFSSFNNGRLTYINRTPSDLTDIYVRKEVLFKMSKITADVIYVLVPNEIIRGWVCSTSLSEKRPSDQPRDMACVIDYLRMCVMTFMKHTISDSRYCQFLLTPSNDYRYTSNLIAQEINRIFTATNNRYSLSDVVFLGANGGANGYGSTDKSIADACSIDFLDTNILLNY